jgi:pimeloyl-ACP methyl ester carboxylesterase
MPTLNIDGVSLHVRERGTGETVLLLHSAGNTGAQWKALGDALGDGFRLLAPDLYDCGATSAWTQDREMGYDDVGGLMSPLLKQNGPLPVGRQADAICGGGWCPECAEHQ